MEYSVAFQSMHTMCPNEASVTGVSISLSLLDECSLEAPSFRLLSRPVIGYCELRPPLCCGTPGTYSCVSDGAPSTRSVKGTKITNRKIGTSKYYSSNLDFNIKFSQ